MPKIYEEEFKKFIVRFSNLLEKRLKDGINVMGKDIKNKNFESGKYVSSPILKKTGAMVNAISIKADGFKISSDIPQVFGKSGRNYAGIHNEGEGPQKKREFFGVPKEFDSGGKVRELEFNKVIENTKRRIQ